MMGGVDALPDLMTRNAITVVVETLGSEGAQVFFDSKAFRIPGRKVHAVDATGAGDAFWGGFLSSLRLQGVSKAADLSEEILRKAMEYGNISGSICVQSKGAIASLPTREQIEALLEK